MLPASKVKRQLADCSFNSTTLPVPSTIPVNMEASIAEPVPSRKPVANWTLPRWAWGLAVVVYLLHPGTVGAFLPQPQPQETLWGPGEVNVRLLAAPAAVALQLREWLWPVSHAHSWQVFEPAAYLRSGVIYLLLLVLAVRHSWRRRAYTGWLAAGLTWAILTALPFAGVPPWTSLPFPCWSLLLPGVGLALAFAALWAKSLAAWQRSTPLPLRWRSLQVALNLGLSAWLILMLMGTGQRVASAFKPEAQALQDIVYQHQRAAAVPAYLPYLIEVQQLSEARSLLSITTEHLPWLESLPAAWEQLEAAELKAYGGVEVNLRTSVPNRPLPNRPLPGHP